MAERLKWVVKIEMVGDDGQVRTVSEVGTIERLAVPDALAGSVGCSFGLSLAEGKSLLRQIQATICQQQVDEAAQFDGACPHCGQRRAPHDRRKRTVQTLHGRITVDVPRFRACRCGQDGSQRSRNLHRLLPGTTTPEFDHVVAELGARHSFREAARILDLFVPARRRHNHMTARSRLAVVSDQITARDAHAPYRMSRSTGEPPSVFIDGTYVRAVPGYQTRYFEVVMGRIDATGQRSRHFATMPHVASARHEAVHVGLRAQGWLPGQPITVFSDGDISLLETVRRASHGDLTHILDWFHVSMRIQHLRECCVSLVRTDQSDDDRFKFLNEDMDGLRSALWCGRMQLARTFTHSAKRQLAGLSATDRPRIIMRKLKRMSKMVEDFDTYLALNQSAMPNYAIRSNAGLAVSSSRAESMANAMVNLRMNKRRQMRWSPEGAQKVLRARVAVMDGRLKAGKLEIAA